MRFNRTKDKDWAEAMRSLLKLEETWSLSTAVANVAVFAGILYLGVRGWFAGGIVFDFSTALVLAGLGGVIGLNLTAYLFQRGIRKKWRLLNPDLSWADQARILDRNDFFEVLDLESRRAGRYRFPLTVCRLELDDLESYGNHFGREKAEAKKEEFGRLMRSAIRETDTLAFYGNNEFCVLLPHTDIVRSEKFVSRVLSITAEKIDSSFSAGLTPYRPGEAAKDSLDRALNALQHAKQGGQRKVCCIIGRDNQEALVQF